MQIVTLTTDWKNGDYNTARLRACILSCCRDVEIVDITHNIQSHSTLQAAFILKNTYKYFPKGSIHIIGVSSEPSQKNEIAAMKNDGHFFIGTNNGMLSSVCDEQPEAIVALRYDNEYQSFRALTMFANCVKAISTGLALEDFGETCELKQEFTSKPSYYESRIIGRVIYIDAFGNAITNIEKTDFEKIGKNRKFEIAVQNNFVKITTISQFYDDVKSGRILALFNSIGLLELSINEGNIATLNGLDTKSAIIVKFIDEY
jgi:S-adenosylmethionine hydrolase